MNKFIPYEKLSKKEKRRLDAARRTDWGSTNPVTRKPENSRAYNRKKAQTWKKELPGLRLVFYKGKVNEFILAFRSTVPYNL